MSHRVHTYDRWSRIRKRLLALRLAPTVKDFDGELLTRRNSRPLSSAVVGLGAVGLSAEFSNNRAATAVTVPPTIGK